MRGYGGRILFVDVTTGSSRVEPVSETLARTLLGGNGFAARLLLDHVPPGVDAYDPGNAVVFAVGPVTDTTVPGNSRACVAGKSPLTGLFFDSTFGGRFPATMKRTGFDAIVITGCAAEPVYVKVTEAGAELRPARSLWGQTTRDTVQAIHAVEGGDADVMAIGPGGEDVSLSKVTAADWMATDSLNLNAAAILDFKHGWAVGPNGTIARYIDHAAVFHRRSRSDRRRLGPLPTKFKSVARRVEADAE